MILAERKLRSIFPILMTHLLHFFFLCSVLKMLCICLPSFPQIQSDCNFITVVQKMRSTGCYLTFNQNYPNLLLLRWIFTINTLLKMNNTSHFCTLKCQMNPKYRKWISNYLRAKARDRTKQAEGMPQTGNYSMTSRHLFPFAGQHQRTGMRETHKDNSKCASPQVYDLTMPLYRVCWPITSSTIQIIHTKTNSNKERE